MSSSDLALSVYGLSKAYTIAHNTVERHVTLAEAVLHRLRRPFHRADTETFWALKDVSFDIKKGEVVGIIGRNGAGKSTLLKTLSRITEPTAGEINLYGRVGSLLEVGTGFHPELTGRENILLNGAILGMTKAEVRKQFDAIVDFAGVEQFLDTPVKRYSSGMYVRLAFAVAAHLESEILIVDEVLAVGDAEFQKKCLGKMKEVATGGKTVLLVSHDQRSIADTCRKTLMLRSGRIEMIGTPAEVFKHYASVARPERRTGVTYGRNLGNDAEICDPVMGSATYFSDEPIQILFSVLKKKQQPRTLNAIAEIVNASGQIVTVVTSLQCSVIIENGLQRMRFIVRSPRLRSGRYSINLALEEPETLDRIDDALRFEILPPRDRAHGGFRLLHDGSIVHADADCEIAAA